MSAGAQRADVGHVARMIFMSLLASPATAFWAADLARTRRSLRWGFAASTVAAGIFLYASPWRWQMVAAGWTAFCVVGGLLVGSLSRAPRAPQSSQAWAQKTLQAALPIAALLPCLLALTRLATWTLLKDPLAWLNPRAIDPSESLGYLVIDAFWMVPLAWVFVAMAYRRGRLGNGRDFIKAGAAWIALISLRELVIQGGFGALRSQRIQVEGFASWGSGQGAWIYVSLAVAIVPMANYLAWGVTSAFSRRLLRVGLVLVAAFFNLGLVVGANSLVQFTMGRVLERSSEAKRALRWYDRSLRSNTNGLLGTFLHHRVGLLQYKEGDLNRARAAWKVVAVRDGESSQLGREATYFLDSLDTFEEGHRQVLPGLELRSELRRAYCAPNTMALAFTLMGREVSVGELAEKATLIGFGTMGSDIRGAAKEYGLDLHLQIFASMADLRWLIDHGFPALIYIPGHVYAVVGYDDALGTIVSYDTGQWDTWMDRPLPEFEEEWGEGLFQLGVLLPRDSDDLPVIEARQRFATAMSRATWHWSLGLELDGERADEQFRRALREDRLFFMAAFDLVENHSTSAQRDGAFAWLEDNASLSDLADHALVALDRPYAPLDRFSYGLARLLTREGQLEAVVDLAVRMEQRDYSQAVQPLGGQAAARLGRWEQALAMIADEVNSYDPDVEVLMQVLNSHLELGQEDLAFKVLETVVPLLTDVRLDSTLDLAESLGNELPRGLLAPLYAAYLESRPFDVEAYLRLASLAKEAIPEDPSRGREQKRQARAAAVMAKSLATTDAQARRATEILDALKATR